MKRTLIIGNFGTIKNKLDGQTIKTRNIYKILSELNSNILSHNTEERGLINFISLLIKCFTASNIIILPAHNSLKYLFPIVFIISLLRRNSIYYVVIGGWLLEFIKNKQILCYFLKNIECVFSETKMMKYELEKIGFDNVVYLPNFRDFDMCEATSDYSKTTKLKAVFMSRIQELKGVETIIESAIQLSQEDKHITIDFYGQIDPSYKDRFMEKIRLANNCSYLGSLMPDEIRNQLAQYDVLLLPTKYFTEGLPGAIIDAYSVGIPVVVTRWKHADEFVQNMKTGLIMPFGGNYSDLTACLELLINDPKLLRKLKKGARNESYYFTKKYAKSILLEYI